MQLYKSLTPHNMALIVCVLLLGTIPQTVALSPSAPQIYAQNQGTAASNFNPPTPWWDDAGIATWALVGVGLVAAIIAICTLGDIRDQTRHTEIAALAAKQSADHAMLDTRAWVRATSFSLDADPKSGNKFTVSFGITNCGKTPAIKVTTAQRIQVGPTDPQTAVERNRSATRGDCTVWPEQTGLTITMDPVILSPSQLAAYTDKTEFVYAEVVIWYNDIFEKSHWTTVRIKHTCGDPLSKFAVCPVGNETDDG